MLVLHGGQFHWLLHLRFLQPQLLWFAYWTLISQHFWGHHLANFGWSSMVFALDAFLSSFGVNPEANTFVRPEVCGIFEVFNICFKSGCLYKNHPLNFSQNYKLHQNTKVRLSYDQNLSYQSLLLLIFMPQSSIKSCFCVPQVPLCLFANFSIPHTRIWGIYSVSVKFPTLHFKLVLSTKLI